MFPSPVRSDNWRFENLVNFNTNSYLPWYIYRIKINILKVCWFCWGLGQTEFQQDQLFQNGGIKWEVSQHIFCLGLYLYVTYSGLTRVAYCIPAYSMRNCASTSSKVWICVKQACRHVPIVPRSEKDQLINGNIDRCLKDHFKLGERVSKYL